MEEKLIPFYQHLMDGYYVKVEETEVDITQVKEEPQDINLVETQDDNLAEPQALQLNSNTTNIIKVNYLP